MIFPDRPKRIDLTRASTYETVDTVDTVETPLRCLAETVELNGVSAANWRIGAKDPAAIDPIDWFARDAWEFYLLCVCMIAWCTYWLGVHRGTW
jgi:hypothetical protein